MSPKKILAYLKTDCHHRRWENGDMGRAGSDFQGCLGETVKGGKPGLRQGNLQHLDIIESLFISVLYRDKELIREFSC